MDMQRAWNDLPSISHEGLISITCLLSVHVSTEVFLAKTSNAPHVRLGRHHELVVQYRLDRRLMLEKARGRMNVHRLICFERPVRIPALL